MSLAFVRSMINGLCQFLACCMLLVSAHTKAADFLVFTDQRHPVFVSNDVPVIYLDAAAEIEAELASGLPADPRRAEAIVRQQLGDGGTDLQARLASAYQSVVDAWNLGISKLPAVVVEGRYVLYGDTDVARAIATIEAYKRAQQ